MERGLLWLPLLAVFVWLARAGWNEYQKVEAYRRWAEQFDRAKYDIYSVLGLLDNHVTWGKPTRNGPVDLQTFSLDGVDEIRLLVDNRPASLESLPAKGKPVIEFHLMQDTNPIQIPFTEIPLAAQWTKYLQQKKQENSKEWTEPFH